jgi:hypothetical protein
MLQQVQALHCGHFHLTQMRKEFTGERNRVTLLSPLGLVSTVVALWPVTEVLMPRADWGNGLGADHQVQWMESWHRPFFRTLVVAFLLCFFGRLRLIAPIAVACVGTALFWLASTMP